MKKIHLLILPVFFFGLIFFFFFNQIGQWITFKQTDENRNFSQMPALRINRLDDFPEGYDAYLKDNFTFRVPFLKAYHELKYSMHISPHPEKALIGTGGHLFLSEKDQEVYSGMRSFGKPQLDSMGRIWQERKAYFGQKDIPFYWFIAPFKHHVYEKNLPLNVYEYKGNRSRILESYFAQKQPGLIIYPLTELKSAAGKELLYFKLDNHWNKKGGWIAYQALMQALRKADPALKTMKADEMQWTATIKNEGKLANFIGKEGELGDYFPEVSFPGSDAAEAPNFGFPFTPGFPYPDQYEKHFVNPKAKNKKRVLVIRDSFGDALMPFLNETFSETLYIFDAWQYQVNGEIIDRYKPDLVIFVTMEALLDNVLLHPEMLNVK